MQSLWRDEDAKAAIEKYGKQGVNADLALRVYTTRLLGGDGRLVLHGGGNTSVKTRMVDPVGDTVDVLCVKGSGWDMGTIEPPGLPAVRLDPLRRLKAREALSDEEMVNFQRVNLLDANAPNPSVETLFHAFLPQKFIDHTHANAVLAVSDQPDGETICAEIYGARAPLVPYVMAGFSLAKAATAIAARHPKAEGMILLNHGIFSWGESAREAYERMIDLVTLAERRLEQGRKVLVPAGLPKALMPLAEVAPVLRGAIADPIDAAEGTWRRQVLAFRTSPAIRKFVDGAELARYAQLGTVTPDHVIRTKPLPLIVPAPDTADAAGFQRGVKLAVEQYRDAYRAYFERNNARLGGIKKPLDPSPRIVLVPGLGLFGAGASAKDAAVAVDLWDANIETISAAETIGQYQPVSEEHLFDIEYWSLEQAKLGKSAEKPLGRQVALVTGGAGGIGAATARAFAAEGAAVVVLDLDGEGAARVAKPLGGIGIACDVTDAKAVAAAFDRAAETFGGVDIVVSNAGAAFQGRIGEVAEELLRRSFELNFFAHQSVAQRAVKVFKAQGTGGALLFNVSKQAVNPGPDFGPYGLPKAAALFLSRQYAVDYGADGIRSNAVNADRVNTGIFAGGLLESRAKARGLTVAQYLSEGNLLKREVKTEDVAKAFVALALQHKTTGAVLTVDGGNIAAALR
jgi:rhamnulose-1-phosphate aldolase/alcohol dehydrogenase